jgi:hypothetical protein
VIRQIFSNRVVPSLLIFILSILLSGCAKGTFGGITGIFSNDSVSEPAESPPVSVMPEEQTIATLEAAPPEELKSPVPLPIDNDKILQQLFNLGNPEEIAPLLPRAKPADAGARTDNGLKEKAGSRGRADLVYHDVMLTEDTAWRGEVLVEGSVTVAQQATLTVENGTVIRFRGASGADSDAALMVLGRLVVKGTKASPVVFRSAEGGASWGEWKGIVLTGSGKRNQIENCRVDGAWTGIDASFSTVNVKNLFVTRCRTGARLQDTLTTVDGLEVVECGTGMILSNSEAEVRVARITGNRLGIFAGRSSLALTDSVLTGNNILAFAAEGSKLKISGNDLSSNGNGILVRGGEGALSDNRIKMNSGYGVVLAGSRIKVKGNLIERNGRVGLYVGDGQGGAWGNALLANGEYDLYNGGTDEFRAVGNWWGTAASGNITARIYDRNRDGSRGRVLFYPPLHDRPELDGP